MHKNDQFNHPYYSQYPMQQQQFPMQQQFPAQQQQYQPQQQIHPETIAAAVEDYLERKEKKKEAAAQQTMMKQVQALAEIAAVLISEKMQQEMISNQEKSRRFLKGQAIKDIAEMIKDEWNRA